MRIVWRENTIILEIIMPSQNDQLLENAAWRSLDRYCVDNPKPRLSARTKQRCKLWIRARIGEVVPTSELRAIPDYVFPINDDRGQDMLEYARRTLED